VLTKGERGDFGSNQIKPLWQIVNMVRKKAKDFAEKSGYVDNMRENRGRCT